MPYSIIGPNSVPVLRREEHFNLKEVRKPALTYLSDLLKPEETELAFRVVF